MDGKLYVIDDGKINPETGGKLYKISLEKQDKYVNLFEYKIYDYFQAQNLIDDIFAKYKQYEQSKSWFELGEEQLKYIENYCKDKNNKELPPQPPYPTEVVPIAKILQTFNNDPDHTFTKVNADYQRKCMASARINYLAFYITSNADTGVRFSWQYHADRDYFRSGNRFSRVKEICKQYKFGKNIYFNLDEPKTKDEIISKIWIDDVNENDPFRNCLAIAKATRSIVDYN